MRVVLGSVVVGLWLLGCGGRLEAQIEPSVPRFWGEADYLLLFGKAQSVPPLVTTGPGPLGTAGTNILLQGDMTTSPFSAGRLVLGGWVVENWGIEGSYLFVGQQTSTQTFAQSGAPGTPNLNFPYVTPGGTETSAAIATPGAFAGTADLLVKTKLQGAEALGVADLYRTAGGNFQAVAGYRYLDLSEDLAFSTSSTSFSPGVASTFYTRDYFRTVNDFQGGTLGLRGERIFGAFSLRASGKVALGNMQQVTQIAGQTDTNKLVGGGFNTLQSYNSAYLAQPSNIGQYVRNQFAAIPEVSVGAGWRILPNLKLNVGYEFLYVSSVARPADAIDRTINPSQSPAISGAAAALSGPARPTFLGSTSDYWLQGVSFGLEWRY